MKRTISIAALIFLAGATAFAQSNEMIDRLLADQTADFGDSLQLVLSAGNRIDSSSTSDEAYAEFERTGWRLSKKGVEDELSVSELSYLIMKSLDLRGGLMYTILPSPRYAFRELVYLGVISRQVPPGRIVSGEQVVRYLGAVLRLEEAR